MSWKAFFGSAIACTLYLFTINPAFADDDSDSDSDSDSGSGAESSIEIERASWSTFRRQLVVSGELDDDRRQTVVLSDALTGAVLAERSSGEDFRFRIRIPEGAPVPCSVAVSAGGETSSRSVRRAPENCSKFTKVLTGLITDGPIPGATVSVTLNGVTYTTVADQNGFYSLPIAATTIGELVKIEATGEDPETGTPIDFVSFAGSFEKIVEDEPENVTNVTTASFILAVEANGGSEPTTIEELQAAETAIDATELFQLSAVIKLIVDDPDYELPAEFDSIVDFISDESAVDAFVASADPADIDASLNEILSDSDLVQGFTLESVPARYINIPTANPGFLARGGQIFDFDGDTLSGRLLDQDGQLGLPINTGFTWDIMDGRIEVTFDLPVTQEGVFNDFNELASEVNQDRLRDKSLPDGIGFTQSTFEQRFTRVTDGALVDTAIRESVFRRDFFPVRVLFDCDINGENCTEDWIALDPEELTEQDSITLRSSEDAQVIPLVAECPAPAGAVCVPGTWGGTARYSAGEWLFSPGYIFPETNYGELLTFGTDGSVSGAVSGLSASWTVQDGSLIITYTDGAEQKVTLVDNVDEEYGAVVEYTNVDTPFATYAAFVKGENIPVLNQSLLELPADKLWNGEVNNWIPGFLDENGVPFDRFGWKFDSAPPDGVGRNISSVPFRDFDCVGGDGVIDIVAFERQTTWNVRPDGSLEIDRSAPSGQELIRSWYPVNLSGAPGNQKLIVVELEESGPFIRIPARINIQRERERRNFECVFPF